MKLRLPQTLVLRLTLAIAAAVLVASLIGFGLAYVAVLRIVDREVDAAIDAESEVLLQEYGKFGAAGLRARVEALSLRGSPLENAVRLRGGGEVIFSGRPFAAPEGLRGRHDIVQPQDKNRILRAIGTVLSDGTELVIARDLSRVHRVARRVAVVLLLTGLLTAGLVAVAGLLLAQRAERRLAALSAAALAVMAGDLSRRLPHAGSGDELDRLIVTINEMLGRIEALLGTLKQVTNDLAHDLRGPLWRLRQRLEGALAGHDGAKAGQDILPGQGIPPNLVEAALADLDGVLATFAALLRIAQVEAGARRAAFVSLDLSALVAGVAETYAAVAEEAGARLVATVAPGISIHGDAALLRQLLANLIENSLNHGGPGVRIDVILRPGPVLEVADTGPGVPAGLRDKVLQRFYRLDRSRGMAGTGLGLALVDAVARLHGGALRLADAHPGRVPPGLRICIVL